MELNNSVVEALLTTHFFENCGKSDALLEGVNYTLLSDRNKVVKNINGIKWENICLEERNNLTGYLIRNNKDIYNKYWNILVRYIKDNVISKIIGNIESQVTYLGLPEDIIDSIKFDIVNIIMVLTYQDYYDSPFYRNMLKIYLNGHLPCGWNGKYPKGNVYVY